MASDFDYEKMVAIDQYGLDKEWSKQPEYMMAVMAQLAQAKKEYDTAKDTLAIKTAELDQEIREDASAEGRKITEKAIEGEILRSPEIQDLQRQIVDARYNINMLDAARAGLENKRDALSNLVKLHGMTYFAEPEADIETRGKLDEIRQEEAKKKVKINRPKKEDEKSEPEEPKPMRRTKTNKKEQ